MKLHNLVKPIDQMTEEELFERLRTIRHNRERARPVAKRQAARTEKKESNRRITSTEKLLMTLSDEERAELLSKLEGQ